MNIRIVIRKIDIVIEILENLKEDLLKAGGGREQILNFYAFEKKIDESHINILRLLAKGYTLAEIANELNIKMRTVEGIVNRLKMNNHYKNTTQMVADMVKRGII